MHRPKDTSDEIGISPATLRLWSNNFAEVLSPAAQKSTTETGSAAQRRYTDGDLAIFRRAKQLLADGLTYEQTFERLKTEPVEKPPEPPESTQTNELPREASSLLPADINDHPVFVAFREALSAKDETIAAKDQVIAGKDETIAQLQARLHQVLSVQPAAPAPIVVQPKFRWEWLNKLLTEEAQPVG